MNGDPEVEAPFVQALFSDFRPVTSTPVDLGSVLLLNRDGKEQHAVVIATDGEPQMAISKLGQESVFLHNINNAFEFYECNELALPADVNMYHVPLTNIEMRFLMDNIFPDSNG